ncbi:MAG: hypothetical protein CMJ36_04905 [Phycisphaerae bacterium]|nr:hypothetical protein [Phycisphaerae bacterium]
MNVPEATQRGGQVFELLSTSIKSASWSEILVSSLPVLVIAFLVTLLVTPLYRRLAISMNIVDAPSESRKIHSKAVPYLGGLAIATGLLVSLILSYPFVDQWPLGYRQVPVMIIVGMIAICFTGLLDDVKECDSWIKVSGMLIAAAGLAVSNVGTRVAAGLLDWLFGIDQLTPWALQLGGFSLNLTELIGGLIIGIFVLGGCNATNLIDGLDGLLSGVVAIIAIGLLAISLSLIGHIDPIDVERIQSSMGPPGSEVEVDVTLAGVRVVLCLALLGTVLGFLPYNFNPATIFLGDCGSLLLGYMCVVIILMLGEAGQTHLVLAGLIVFSIPIIDTLLAIVRRRVQGVPLWDPDDKHLHHMIKRRTGSVRRAVLSIYGIGIFFAVLGASLGILWIDELVPATLIYLVFLLIMSIVVLAGFRMGRRARAENHAS